MPPVPPPDTFTGTPVRRVLPAGSRLWRTHRADVPAIMFDPPRDRVFGGRRFDGTSASGYGVLYASPNEATAVAERVLPEFDLNPAAPRMLTQAMLSGEVLSALETTVDLPLLSLVSATDLAAVQGDTWLVTERDGAYPSIREWGAWLREHVPWSAGFIWQSTVDMPELTLVLFADKCPGGLRHLPELQRPLGNPDPPTWLRDTLARRGVHIYTPPTRKPAVFLNYRTGDGDGTVLLLHNELARRLTEPAVFRDTYSIPPGADYRPVLRENVRGAQVMLAVIGPNWEWASDRNGNRLLDNENDWIRKEILLAWENNVEVIPILVGARTKLDPDDLPEPLSELAYRQYLHLPSGGGEPEIEQLVTRLMQRRPDLN